MDSAYETYLKEFKSAFHYLSAKHGGQRIFHDFVKMCAIALYNPFAKNQELEKEYLNTINYYQKEERDMFPKMLGKLVMMYDTTDEMTDILGEFYEREYLSNKILQQFFTPMHIAKFMAEITTENEEELKEIIEENGFIRMDEPTCGSGVMILGLASALKRRNINYQRDVLVYANDISDTCAYMTYIQLSLYGIPAIVTCGNALTNEVIFKMETPFFFTNYIKFRKAFLRTAEDEETKKITINKNIFKEHTVKGNCQISLW